MTVEIMMHFVYFNFSEVSILHLYIEVCNIWIAETGNLKMAGYFKKIGNICDYFKKTNHLFK